MPLQTKNISIAEARALMTRALIKSGASDHAADLTASALVAAEAEGQIGHGFSRLGDYCAQLRTGKVKGQVPPTLQWHGAASLSVDAGNSFAFPSLELAIQHGSVAARKTGCCAMAVYNSHHCGALSIQVEKIALQGLIGIMVANAPRAMAPWGGHEPILGTNPIAFAAPRTNGPPLVIDLSLSRVARGKVMHAKKSDQPIPEGWALDNQGNPTTDPDAALNGTMVPAGDAKGAALAIMVEVLASSLTGASPSEHMTSFFEADGRPPNAGQFLLAIAPPDEAGFLARIEPLLVRIETMQGARLPGKRRFDTITRAKTHGLDVPLHYVQLAVELGA